MAGLSLYPIHHLGWPESPLYLCSPVFIRGWPFPPGISPSGNHGLLNTKWWSPTSARTVLLELSSTLESTGDLVEMQIQIPWGWGRSLGFCISNELPGGEDSADKRTAFEQQGIRALCFYLKQKQTNFLKASNPSSRCVRSQDFQKGREAEKHLDQQWCWLASVVSELRPCSAKTTRYYT